VSKLGEIAGKLPDIIKNNKYITAAVIIGIILMVLPTSTSKQKAETTSNEPPFSLSEQEKKLEDILKRLDGAGNVKVMLTLESGAEEILAYDTTLRDTEEKNDVVTVNNGSGVTEPIAVKYIYPKYLGAAIVCEGADSSIVRLNIIETVAAVTGLTADKISVIKMK